MMTTQFVRLTDIPVREAWPDEARNFTPFRRRFWNRYLQRHPGVFTSSRHSNVWIRMPPDGEVVLSMYVGSKTSGMFLRGPFGTGSEHLAPFMSRHADTLEQALGPNQSTSRGFYFGTSQDIAVQQESRWDERIDWMDLHRPALGIEVDPPWWTQFGTQPVPNLIQLGAMR